MSENELTKYSFRTVIRKMLMLSFRTSPWPFLSYLLATILFTASLIADLYLIRVLVEDLAWFADGKIAYKPVLLTILLLGAANIICTLMNATLNLLSEYLGKKTSARMTEDMAEKANTLDLIRFESSNLYDDIEKASLGRDLGYAAMEQIVFKLIFHGGYFLFLFLYLAPVKPMLILVIVASFLPYAFSWYIRASAFYNVENRIAPIRREFNHYEECLTSRTYFKETRTLRAGSYFRDLYDQTLGTYNNEMWRTEARTGRIDIVLKALTLVGYAGVLGMLVLYLLRSEISPGMFGAVFFALDNIFKWFENLLSELGQAYQNAAIGGNYLRFMDLPIRHGGSDSLCYNQGVELDCVSFRYPGAKQNSIRNTSLTIMPGESLAIVGENGAGKSTLVRLITGMYLPDEGRVLLGGANTRQASKKSRYCRLSAIFQTYQRYQMTLENNISISEARFNSINCEDSPTSNRFRIALSQAGFDIKADRFEQGLHTMLSREFGGVELSGGEWQRVAIARGLYRNHDMIVLDEPTAAIDPLEETALYKRFIDAVENKTSIIVTHRLGSARIADRIIVMAGGMIVEDGTHEQLIALNGKYARMFDAQSKRYDRR